MSCIFAIENLKKSYRDSSSTIEVLKDVSFTLQSGESLALIGQSGSGKSTLLALMAGLENPDTGKILFKDENLLAYTDQQMTRWRAFELGMIFQQFHLDLGLTALENIAFGLATQDIPWKKCLEEAQVWLEKFGLTPLRDKFPSTLSGGEKQRVAIARAMIKKPSILLADEPTGNLDAKTGKVVVDLMFARLKEEKNSLILVTHDLELAKRCDRTLLLQDGVLHSHE